MARPPLATPALFDYSPLLAVPRQRARSIVPNVRLHVWCHVPRHTSITQAAELGQRAGLGLEKIRAHSRHCSIATLMIYVDEHDR
jgi:hypothetical protein